MARRNRNNIEEVIEIEVVSKSERFQTAIYARLSAENSGKTEKRDVIANQVEVCKNYIFENPHLDLMDTYIDNGQSGTKFDRPEFNRLMEDIKTGKVTCLVVRDLSRFGRDYIETGTYMERVFPNIGLRFISVNERYDSFTVDTTNESLMIPLQNMINTLYAKDISRKIFTAHRTRMLSGDFKRNTLPYGYMLDETRFNILIDEQAAKYVRMIFNWKIQRKTVKEIMQNLEELNAPNPRIRKAETGVQTGDASDYSGWHYSSIQNMLKNHTYIGHTVIGKKIRSLFKGIRCEEIKDPQKWIVLENTHEAIITLEEFNKVQEMFREASELKQVKMLETEKIRSAFIDLFEGRIFCADCGSKMSFIKSRNNVKWYANYKCTLYNRKKQCTIHSINQEKLNIKVLSAIKTQVGVALDYEKLILKLKNTKGERSIRDRQNTLISSLNLKINGVQRKRARLYEDFADGLLDGEEYSFAKLSYDEEFARLTFLMEEAILRRTKFNDAMSSNNKWISLMKSVSGAKQMTQSLVDEVIELVKIHEGGDIELVMKYADIYALTIEKVKEVREEVA